MKKLLLLSLLCAATHAQEYSQAFSTVGKQFVVQPTIDDMLEYLGMSTVTIDALQASTPAETRAALGIYDLIGTNGIALTSSNLVGFDTDILTIAPAPDGTNCILVANKLISKIRADDNINFVHATNLAAGVQGQLLIFGTAATKTLTFPATWVFLGAAAPTSIASNKVGNLAWTVYGTDQTNVICGYAVQP